MPTIMPATTHGVRDTRGRLVRGVAGAALRGSSDCIFALVNLVEKEDTNARTADQPERGDLLCRRFSTLCVSAGTTRDERK